MLKDTFVQVYDKFKMNFYKNIFRGFYRNHTTLTVTETFCLEVIYSLKNPTVSELSKYLGISQPNTTYKVNELITKGYVVKKRDPDDKRRVKIYPTELFNKYYVSKNEYMEKVMGRIKERFSKEELDIFEKILKVTSEELMPEVTTK